MANTVIVAPGKTQTAIMLLIQGNSLIVRLLTEADTPY